MLLIAERLTSENFSPFGDVVVFDAGLTRIVNDGRALRADSSAKFDNGGTAVPPVLAIYHARGEGFPLTLSTFERHPLSSQLFVALSAQRFLIVVAPASPNGSPDQSRAKAFVGHQGEGVNYARNIWHTPITAIGDHGDFMMLAWENGSPDDCIVHEARPPLQIDFSEQ